MTVPSAVSAGAAAAERTKATMASTAPLRITIVSVSIPLNLVYAEKGRNFAWSSPMSRPRMPYFSFASTTIERPSGVSSERDASCAASASSFSLMPGSGMNSAACRLPSVIVPVLSRSSVSTSPAASPPPPPPPHHRENIDPQEPVHPGDSDRRQKRADRGRNEGDEKRNEDD